MARRYSPELGRFVDEDDELPQWSPFQQSLAHEPYPSRGIPTNPYDDDGAPMPGDNAIDYADGGVDMEIGLDEVEEAPSRIPLNPYESDNETSATHDDTGLVKHGETWAGAGAPLSVKQQTFRPASLADTKLMGEHPRQPERSAETNPETLGLQRKAEDLGGLGDTGDVPRLPAGALGRPPAPADMSRNGPVYEAPSAQTMEPPAPPGPRPQAPPDLGPGNIRHDQTTANAQSPDPLGRKPNTYGVEDEQPVGQSMPERLKRAMELYEKRYGSLETPEGDQGPGYQPYQPEGYRQTDEDMRSAYIGASIFGERGDNIAVANMYRGLQNDYDQRNAQGADRHLKAWIADKNSREGNQPLSAAQVQQLVLSGVDPETAVYGNQGAVKLASSLGAVGTREHKIEADIAKTDKTEFGKNHRQHVELDQKGRIAGQGDETKRRGQDINAENVRLQQEGKQADPAAERATRVQHVMDAADVSRRDAEDIVDSGDTSALAPSAQKRVERALLGVDAQGGDKKGIARMGASAAAGDARTQDSVERKLLDPGSTKDRLQLRNELSTANRVIDGALSGYDELAKDPRALDAFVKIGQASDGSVLSQAKLEAKLANMPPAAQQAAARIMIALSKTAFDESGKTLTTTEAGMFGSKSGVTLGSGYAVFRDPGVLKQYLQQLNKARHSYRKNVASTYGDLESN